MVVKLTLLDKLQSLGYDETGEVAIAGDRYEIVGTITVFKDNDGNHLGKLKLNRQVHEKLYFYYTFGINNNIPWFKGLQLNESERKESPTSQLKDMIVSH